MSNSLADEPLAVLYEDNHLLVVEKPAGVLTQSDKSGEDSLLEMCRRYVRKRYNKQGNVFIGMVHRLGRMEIGEASVVVVATAPHREAAFEAAMEGIDRLKKAVPIWKKEHFAGGEVWVEGEWDESLRNR